MFISKKFLFPMVIFGVLTLSAGSALAESGFLNSFNSQYGTSGTDLDSCTTCHPSGFSSLNAYGSDYKSGGFSFPNIEGLDSDGDGFVNIDEINARTFPGDASSFPVTLPTCTDNDGDGFSIEGGACGVVDCNDANSQINPNAQESCTDNIDNNCNGLIDNQDPQAVGCPPVCTDNDGDGFAIEGGNCGAVDCNDNAQAVNPGAAENCTDNIDNDCDSLIDTLDPDAVGCPVEPPPAPTCTDNDQDGFSIEGGDCGLIDCNDADSAIHPEAIEVCTDGFDNNCDGLVDSADPNAVDCPAGCTDLDLDGYAVEGGDCGPIDCNDLDETIHPSAAEDCSDNVDNDCDDLIDSADPDAVNCSSECVDLDGDGYAIEGDDCGPADCSDEDATINPGATEICGDGIDQDCSGSDLSCAAVLSAPTLSYTVTGLNLSINWTAIADATGYTLLYAPYPYTGPGSIVSHNVGNVMSFSAELSAGDAFYIAVQARNDQGSSEYSNVEYFIIETPDDSVPDAPTMTYTVTGLNVAVNWTAVEHATGYTLLYAPYPYTGLESIVSVDVGNVTSYSAELYAGATFYIAVQAYNDHGSSEYSNVENFTIR